MNALPRARLGALALAVSIQLFAPPIATALDVARWQPQDFTFTATASPPNPFLVPFTATAQGPGGVSLQVLGFFDGNGTWKIRMAPTVEGAWTIVTKSDLPELNGKTAAFTCVMNPNTNVHGVLRVDPAHPHHFLFDDGTRFFMQGYEYDWLWALDMEQAGVPTVERSLDLIAQHGFNYVILNTYAHDTKWRSGKTGPDDYGPALLYPWAGTNDAPDHSRMNLAYWRHYDRVMTALAERGMQAHMLLKVYNKKVNWPAQGSDEEKLFFRWLVARYAAYPNIIWDFAKEAHYEKDLAYKQGWLKWLRENDAWHHLTTVHDDDVANDSGAYDELTDFRTDQQHKDWHDVVVRQRERRAWPVANVESDYEHGPLGLMDKTFGKAESPEATLRTAWEIAVAGGYIAYYYTYTAWDIVRPLDVPPGYAYFKHFGAFWRATDYWTLEPSDRLVSTGWCLADPGREYVVFLNEAKPFTLTLVGAKSPLPAEWFNPQTGVRFPAGSLHNGVAHLTPPSAWGGGPLVLHVHPKRNEPGSLNQSVEPAGAR